MVTQKTTIVKLKKNTYVVLLKNVGGCWMEQLLLLHLFHSIDWKRWWKKRWAKQTSDQRVEGWPGKNEQGDIDAEWE